MTFDRSLLRCLFCVLFWFWVLSKQLILLLHRQIMSCCVLQDDAVLRQPTRPTLWLIIISVGVVCGVPGRSLLGRRGSGLFLLLVGAAI